MGIRASRSRPKGISNKERNRQRRNTMETEDQPVNWHHNWSTKSKRVYAQQMIDAEVRNIKIFSQVRCWSEVEKALASIRKWAEVLYGLD
jgi:hypothetical protein